MATDKNEDAVRSEVSKAYAEALKESQKSGGCCGGSSPSLAGAAGRLVDYGDQHGDVPQGARQSSFGCGDPLAFSDVQKGDVVLDLGSGAGLDLLIAAKMCGEEGRVIGVDMTDEMIETARKNIAEAGAQQVEVRKGIIEELPVEDASVDWVISNCVINLSPDKERVFAEIHRVLKPGGRFSISDIVAEEIPELIRQEARAYSACIGGAISEAEYEIGLAAAGFEDLSVSERGIYSAEQLTELVGSGCQGNPESADRFQMAAAEAAGKVWSAKFKGRKAAGA